MGYPTCCAPTATAWAPLQLLDSSLPGVLGLPLPLSPERTSSSSVVTSWHHPEGFSHLATAPHPADALYRSMWPAHHNTCLASDAQNPYYNTDWFGLGCCSCFLPIIGQQELIIRFYLNMLFKKYTVTMFCKTGQMRDTFMVWSL